MLVEISTKKKRATGPCLRSVFQTTRDLTSWLRLEILFILFSPVKSFWFFEISEPYTQPEVVIIYFISFWNWKVVMIYYFYISQILFRCHHKNIFKTNIFAVKKETYELRFLLDIFHFSTTQEISALPNRLTPFSR